MTTYVTAGENGIEVTVGMLTRPQLDAVANAEAPSASNEFLTVSALGDLAAEAGATSLEVAAARDAVPNDTEPTSLYDTINLLGQKVHRVDAYAATGVQGAIDAAEVSGGVVEFAAYKSTYTSATALTVTGNVTIEGQGARLRASATQAASTRFLQVTGSNVTVRNLILDIDNNADFGLGIGEATATAISNILVERCEIKNLRQRTDGGAVVGLRIEGGASRVTIRDTYIHDIVGVKQTGAEADYSGIGLYMRRNNDPGGGVYYRPYHNVLIDNCRIENVEADWDAADDPDPLLTELDGLFISGVNDYYAGIVVRDTWFQACRKRFLKLTGRGIRIDGCTFVNPYKRTAGDNDGMWAMVDFQVCRQAKLVNSVTLAYQADETGAAASTAYYGDAHCGVKLGSGGATLEDITITNNDIIAAAHTGWTGGLSAGIGLADSITANSLNITGNNIRGFRYGFRAGSGSTACSMTGGSFSVNNITAPGQDAIFCETNSTVEYFNFIDNSFIDVPGDGFVLDGTMGSNVQIALNNGEVTNEIIDRATGVLPTTFQNIGLGGDTDGTRLTQDITLMRGGVPQTFAGSHSNIGADANQSVYFGSVAGIPMPGPGSVLGIRIKSSEARTAGSLSARIGKNGSSASTVMAVIDGTNTTAHSHTVSKDTYTFVAGDTLFVALDPVGFNTTSGTGVADIDVVLVVEYWLS